MRGELVEQQRRRGRDLARLQVGLRDLDSQLGQWTGWQSQHLSVRGRTDVDMASGVEGLAGVDNASRVGNLYQRVAHKIRYVNTVRWSSHDRLALSPRCSRQHARPRPANVVTDEWVVVASAHAEVQADVTHAAGQAFVPMHYVGTNA